MNNPDGVIDWAFFFGFAGTLFLAISGAFVGALVGESVKSLFGIIFLPIGGAVVGTVGGTLVKKLVGRTSNQSS